MRKIVIILLCLTAVLLAGYASHRGYRVWKQHHMMTLARGFIAKSDGRSALLSLQQVLRSNPRHLEATRLMADLTEAARSPSALLWRNRAVELNPRSADDRLALARTALTFRDYATATNALEGVGEAGRKTAAYHNTAGAVAAAANHFSEAGLHFSEALRLEPQNAAPQLNLAIVRLHGTNDLDLAEARISLKRLCSNPTNAVLRCQAFRELVVDALRFKQADAALALSKELLQQTNSAFTDRLLRLTVLQETRQAEFRSALADYQREAARGTNAPLKIYELAMWQIARTGPKEALVWLRSLPAITQTNQPAAVLIAQCEIALQDWRSLQTTLGKQNWAELEFIRHALTARGLRGQNLAGAAKGEWELALKTSNRQLASLVMLLRLAAQWRWQSETEELLWSIVNQYPGERWAFQALTQVLVAGGRTRPLMMLCGQQLKRTPSDLSVKNNLAMTALLLEANELKPHDLAREVYQQASTNASYASTYAFSLHLQKKDAEALKVMQQLKPKELEDPSIAGYYGLILQATGNRDRAKAYLQWTSKARLLPEEQRLFDRAKTGA